MIFSARRKFFAGYRWVALLVVCSLLGGGQKLAAQAIYDSQSFGSSFGGFFQRDTGFDAPPPRATETDGEDATGEPLDGESTDPPVGEPSPQRFFGPLALIAQLPFDVVFSGNGGYDTNPNYSSFLPAPSAFAGFNLGLNYAFGNPRLKLTTSLQGGLTFFSNSEVREPTRFNGNWSLTSTYTLTPRLIFSANANIGYFSQPNINVSGTNLSQDGDYIAGTITLLGLYQLSPRFSTTLSYSFSPLVYREPLLNDQLGRVQQTVAWAMNYALRPTTTLVAEYRASPTDYFDADLNTFNNFLLVGFDQVFSPRSSWNFRGGAQYNFLNNPIDGQTTYLGPYAETGFTYRYGERSNLFFSLRYGTEAAGQANVTQRQTLRVGATLNHAFGPRLSASLGLYSVTDYYDQANVIEPYYQYNYQASLSLNYRWNRFLSLTASYNYTTLISPTFPTQEYDRGVGTIGVSLNF
jgi:hypothetical protein